jgi:hypothetical protein
VTLQSTYHDQRDHRGSREGADLAREQSDPARVLPCEELPVEYHDCPGAHGMGCWKARKTSRRLCWECKLEEEYDKWGERLNGLRGERS